jgi:hypothetical protein
MSIGVSLILIAAGAILRFAVEIHSRVAGTSVNWDIVGDVLMVVGGIGLVVSLIWVATSARRGRTVVTDRPLDRPV